MKAEKGDFQASNAKPVLVSHLASAVCIQPSLDPFFLAFCPASLIPTVYFPTRQHLLPTTILAFSQPASYELNHQVDFIR